MILPVKFLELAQSELDDIFEAYEYQEKGLGKRFIAEVGHTLKMIKLYPDVWRQNSSQTQKCMIKGFPYGVIYHVIDKKIIVIAIVNLRKKPIHWVSKSVSEFSTCRIPILPETIYIR